MLKNPFAQLPQDIGEAVIKPTIDAFGQALEQGAKTALQVSPPVSDDSQKLQEETLKKQQQEQKTMEWTQQTLQQAKLEAEISAISQKREEQDKQRWQEDDQEDQKVKQLEVVSRNEDIALTRAKTSRENKNFGAG